MQSRTNNVKLKPNASGLLKEKERKLFFWRGIALDFLF
jgi:hypothetical protein